MILSDSGNKVTGFLMILILAATYLCLDNFYDKKPEDDVMFSLLLPHSNLLDKINGLLCTFILYVKPCID